MTKTLTKEQFLQNKKTWSTYCQRRTPGHPEYHLLRLLLGSRDVFTGFKPLQNGEKIRILAESQGKGRYYALRLACYYLTNKLRQCQIAIENPQNKLWAFSEVPGFLTFFNTSSVEDPTIPLRMHINLEMIAELTAACNETLAALDAQEKEIIAA